VPKTPSKTFVVLAGFWRDTPPSQALARKGNNLEDDFDTFMLALKAETDQVRQELTSDRMGFFPVYAMREYDFFFNRYKGQSGGDSSEDFDEMYYLLRLGLPRGLALTLSMRSQKQKHGTGSSEPWKRCFYRLSAMKSGAMLSLRLSTSNVDGNPQSRNECLLPLSFCTQSGL